MSTGGGATAGASTTGRVSAAIIRLDVMRQTTKIRSQNPFFIEPSLPEE
jgi:hypothetical protein